MFNIVFSTFIFIFFMVCFFLVGGFIIYPINQYLFVKKKEIFEKYMKIVLYVKLLILFILTYLISRNIHNPVFSGILVGILMGFIPNQADFPLIIFKSIAKKYYKRNNNKK